MYSANGKRFGDIPGSRECYRMVLCERELYIRERTRSTSGRWVRTDDYQS